MIKKQEDISEQVKKEAKYFDRLYVDAEKKHRLQNYLVPEKLIQQVINPKYCHLNANEHAYSLLGKLEKKKLLDYGAGDGWNSVCFAKAKANVWAIDISEKGIDLIKKKAQANSVGEYIIAEVDNCYKTRFPTDMFDIIYGGGILHHLDIEVAAQEIHRILHPKGVAVFYEPFRETKIMDIIKKIVLCLLRKMASEETENESPLTCKRIEQLRPYFRVVNYRSFNVLTSATLLINSEILKLVLMWLDYYFMKLFPGFKKLGRAVVIELRQPIKNV